MWKLTFFIQFIKIWFELVWLDLCWMIDILANVHLIYSLKTLVPLCIKSKRTLMPLKPHQAMREVPLDMCTDWIYESVGNFFECIKPQVMSGIFVNATSEHRQYKQETMPLLALFRNYVKNTRIYIGNIRTQTRTSICFTERLESTSPRMQSTKWIISTPYGQMCPYRTDHVSHPYECDHNRPRESHFRLAVT